MYTLAHEYISIYVHMNTYTSMQLPIHTSVYTHTFMHLHICAHINMYMFLNTRFKLIKSSFCNWRDEDFQDMLFF